MSRKPKETAPPRAFPVAKSKPAVKTAPATKAIAAPIEEPVVVEPAPVEEAVAVVVVETVAVETAPETIEAAEPVAVAVEAAPAAEEAVPESTPVVEDPVPAAIVETAAPAPTVKPAKLNLLQGMKTMTMIKSTEEIVAFNQANVEAFIKSGQIWAAGVQELTKQFATTAKASFDESVSSFKALTTVKSVKEAVELQTAFAKTAFEKAVAESNKLTDASIKLTEQTLAPITARVTVAVETFGKAA